MKTLFTRGRPMLAVAAFRLIGVMPLVLGGCGAASTRPPPCASPAPQHQDLLTGYELLASTLADESRLGTLDLFKKVTLNAPPEDADSMMKVLSESAKRRGAELEKLRHAAPDVSVKPAAESPVGNAITAIAKDIGKHEMMSRSGRFDVRFVVLQAQATRMVSAMASAIEQYDPNPERKAWLKSLSAEYETYRSGMMKHLEDPQDTKR